MCTGTLCIVFPTHHVRLLNVHPYTMCCVPWLRGGAYAGMMPQGMQQQGMMMPQAGAYTRLLLSST